MLQQINTYLDNVRAGISLSRFARGSALALEVLCVSLILVGSIDYWMRSDSLWWRWCCTVVALGPAGSIFFATFVQYVWARPSRAQVAQLLESRDQEWDGQLMSAVSFSNQENLVAGSPALKRETVRSAAYRLDEFPPVRWTDWKPVGFRLGGACVGVMVVLLTFVVSPSMSHVALARVVNPTRRIAWPHEVTLDVLDESGQTLGDRLILGEGESCRFYVRNRLGDLPSQLTMYLRDTNGRVQSLPLSIVEHSFARSELKRMGTGTLIGQGKRFQFRVVGGDDHSMKYKDVEVVVPPRLDTFQISITPPAYLKSDQKILAVGQTSVHAVPGSKVRIRARANKSLETAELIIGDQPGPPVRLSKNGTEIDVTFLVGEGKSTHYGFRLTDTVQSQNPIVEQYELLVREDLKPNVDTPVTIVSDTVTPTTILPITFHAHDDFGLTICALQYVNEEQWPHTTTTSEPQIIPSILLRDANDDDRPRQFEASLDWQIDGLHLQPGDFLTIRGMAQDACDFESRHFGVSETRTFHVVTRETKHEELVDRQFALINDIFQSQQTVRKISERVDLLLEDLQQETEISARTRDQMSRLELWVSQLGDSLSGDDESHTNKALRIIQEIDAHQINDSQLTQRLELVVSELELIFIGSLARSQDHMTRARKSSKQSEAQQALRQMSSEINLVDDGISALVERLGAWRDRHGLIVEMDDILRAQYDISSDTNRIASQTLGISLDELTADQRDRLAEIGRQQDQAATRLGRLENHVRQLQADQSRVPMDRSEINQEEIEHNSDSSSAIAVVLDNFSSRYAELSLSSLGRTASEQIRSNQMGEAAGSQSQFRAGLEELRQLLTADNPHGSSKDEMTQIVGQLRQLVHKQTEVVQTLAERSDISQAYIITLEHTQNDIRKTTIQLARESRLIPNLTLDALLREAASKMTIARDTLHQSGRDGVVTTLQSALATLKTALRLLENDSVLKEVNEMGGASQAARENTLDQLIASQHDINKSIQKLASEHATRGTFSRSQLLAIRRIAESQSLLLDDFRAMFEFDHDLLSIEEERKVIQVSMQQVCTGLEQRNVGKEIQDAGREVVTNLEVLSKQLDSATRTQQANQHVGSEGMRGNASISISHLEDILRQQLDLRRQLQAVRADVQNNQRSTAGESRTEPLLRKLNAINRQVDRYLPGLPMGEDNKPGQTEEKAVQHPERLKAPK